MNHTRLLMLAALGILAGCDNTAVASRDYSADRGAAIRFGSGPCDSLVVPQGFALGWKKFNHRMSKWGVGLDKNSCAAERFEVTHVGGVFSQNPVIDDEPWVKFSYQRATLGDDLTAARVSIHDVIGPSGVITGTTRFSLDDLGLTGRRQYVALLEGVSFDTGIEQDADYPALYNPERGYTTRGIGARVAADIEGDELVLSYSASFVPGRTPERVFMNSALPYARVGTGIDVIILGARETPMNLGSVSYEMQHERPQPFHDVRLPEASETLRTVAVRGRPGASEGFWGLQSFNFALDLDDDCTQDDDCSIGECIDATCGQPEDRLGEYIREFSVGVDLKEYDAQTGLALFVVDGYTSNASSFVAFYPLRYQFDAGFVWIQADGKTSRGQIDEQFVTGSTSFELAER